LPGDSGAHAERDAASIQIDVQHRHVHDIPNADHLIRVFHAVVGHFGDVDQPVLLDPNIYKRPKVHDVTHGPFERHTGAQVFHLQHIGAQYGRLKLGARVASGSGEIVEDVF